MRDLLDRSCWMESSSSDQFCETIDQFCSSSDQL